MKIKGLISMLLVLFLLVIAGCSSSEGNSSSESEKKGNKTIYIGMVNPPILFNPINSADVSSTFAEKFMFDSFLEMEGPQNFVPKLAEAFETEDNVNFTIKIHKDAKWTDGTPVTAEDAAFTFNLVANPVVETVVGSYFSTFEGLDENGKLQDGQKEIPSVTIVDEKTLTFKTKTPVDINMIKEQLGTKFMILPKHVLKDVDPAKLSQEPFFQNPNVTNGPFEFVEYKKDQYVEYVKNEDYYLGEVELDKLFIKVMPAANLVAQLQTGEIQMNAGAGIGKIAVQDYETVEKMEHVTVKEEETISYQVMLFNTKNIADAKVRQAFGYAVNRQNIVEKLLKGYGEVADGPYTSISPYKDPSYALSYDPEKAKQLLIEAGWDFNKEIDLVVPLGNKVREQSADLITQDLQSIGLKVKVSTFDFPTIMAKAKEGSFDVLLMGYTFTLDPEMSALYSTNGGYNFMSYSNAEVDQLLLEGKAEPDPEKRKVIYSNLQKIWLEDSPVVSLYSDYDFAATSKNVTFGGPRVFGFHIDLHKWDVSGTN